MSYDTLEAIDIRITEIQEERKQLLSRRSELVRQSGVLRSERQPDRRQWQSRRALELRRRGLSFKAIGKLMGVSAASASSLVTSGLWEEQRPAPRDPDDLWNLNISIRTHNALVRGGIRTISEVSSVVRFDKERLIAIANFGDKSFAELVDALIEAGDNLDPAERLYED